MVEGDPTLPADGMAGEGGDCRKVTPSLSLKADANTIVILGVYISFTWDFSHTELRFLRFHFPFCARIL